MGFIIGLVYLAIVAAIIAGMWKAFVKAGQPGWACIVPIYNLVIMLQIAGRPLWWILLFFIPVVNVVMAIIVCNDISKRFGGAIGMTLLLIFLPFIAWPILGFGEATYTATPPQPATT